MCRKLLSLPVAFSFVLLIGAGLFGLGTDRSNAAAIVGQPRTVEGSKLSSDGDALAKLKAKYRKPTAIPFPAGNLYTIEKAVLGKKLFYDPRLSASGALSCGTCHNPSFGWSDGQPTAIGHGMRKLKRRSPAVMNVAWATIFMWDGRIPTLEAQALAPIQSDEEMAMPLADLVARLQSIKGYARLFEAAFPGEQITAENVGKALATYERTIVSGRGPFDLWIEGSEDAISESAKRGFALFNGRARCADCHSGWKFTDDSFHDIGLAGDDSGRGKFLPSVVKMQFAFKTPGLREIGQRSPFMHDGSLPDLHAVIDHYDKGGIVRPSKSDLIKPLGLTEGERLDLLAFLETLSSSKSIGQLPALPQ